MLWRRFGLDEGVPDLGQLLAARAALARRKDVLLHLVDVTANHLHKTVI